MKEAPILIKAKTEGRDSLYPHETALALSTSLRQVHRMAAQGELKWFCVSLGNLRSHRRIYIASIEEFRSRGNGHLNGNGNGNGHGKNGSAR